MDRGEAEGEHERRVQEGLELQKAIPYPKYGRRRSVSRTSDTTETAGAVVESWMTLGEAGLVASAVGLVVAWLVSGRKHRRTQK